MEAPTGGESFLSLLDDISPFFALGSRNPLGASYGTSGGSIG
jgi:hypothetical protein